jgi:protein KRI1
MPPLTNPQSKSKPITIRALALQSALTSHPSRSPSPSPAPEAIPHTEEQRALRASTIAAFHHAVSSDEDGEDGVLVPREKTKDEVEREEEEYREFLRGAVGGELELEGLVEIEEDSLGIRVQEEEGGKKKKKKGKKERKEEEGKSKGKGKSKEEGDQEFLMRSLSFMIHAMFNTLNLSLAVTSSTGVG